MDHLAVLALRENKLLFSSPDERFANLGKQYLALAELELIDVEKSILLPTELPSHPSPTLQ